MVEALKLFVQKIKVPTSQIKKINKLIEDEKNY